MLGILINVGYNNLVSAERIVAIVNPNSVPSKRLRDEAKRSGLLIDASAGHRARSMIVTSSNHVIVTAIEVKTLAQRFSQASLAFHGRVGNPILDELAEPGLGPDLAALPSEDSGSAPKKRRAKVLAKAEPKATAKETAKAAAKAPPKSSAPTKPSAPTKTSPTKRSPDRSKAGGARHADDDLEDDFTYRGESVSDRNRDDLDDVSNHDYDEDGEYYEVDDDDETIGINENDLDNGDDGDEDDGDGQEDGDDDYDEGYWRPNYSDDDEDDDDDYLYDDGDEDDEDDQ